MLRRVAATVGRSRPFAWAVALLERMDDDVFSASYPKEEDNPPVDARAARTILEMVTEGKPQLRASTLAARTTKGDDHDND